MLRHTFIHLPGVGKITEERLWENGIGDWEDLLASLGRLGKLPFSLRTLKVIESHLEASCRYLSQGETGFFEEWLQAGEKWRMYPDFASSAVFLDIETTGLSSTWGDITVIGIYDSHGPRVFVKGENLEDFPSVIKDYSLLVTYNGKQFDVPFLRAKFPDVELPAAHLDMRFPLRRLGLSGGLKGVERRLGMEREGPLQEVDGYMAVRLWQEYVRSNKSALETLIRYNLEDVVVLRSMAERAYNLSIKRLPISLPSIPESERPRLDLPYDPELITWLRRFHMESSDHIENAECRMRDAEF
jgi:uncharacterized protein YprB with RNaseH-like and TPR domain